MNFRPESNPSPSDPFPSDNPLDANTNVSSRPVVERFFEGIVQHTFSSHLGVPDPLLISYVSDFLVRSLRTEALAVRMLNGSLSDDYQTMSSEAQHRVGHAKIEAYQKLGERILFWTGLYPEAVQATASPQHDSSTDSLRLWFDRGKGAYATLADLVVDLPSSKDVPRYPLCVDIADRFEMVAYGLREVRRNLEIDALEGNDKRLIL